MQLFKILLHVKDKKPMLLHWQTMESVPPICQYVMPELWLYSENKVSKNVSGMTYVIDISYQPPVTDLKSPFMIYKLMLIDRMKKERYI